VDVRHLELHDPAPAERADGRSLDDVRARTNGKRPEVGQGNREAVGGSDAQRQSVRRRSAGERDDAGGRSEHGLARRACADVDAAPLSGRIGVGAVKGKGAEHRAVGRPGPRESPRRQREGEHDQAERRKPQAETSCCQY